MTENSLEFQTMPENDSGDDQVRNSFRVPASDEDKVLAVFCNKKYKVVDLSAMGIAVRADAYQEFLAGQIIEDAELVLGDQNFKGLTAKVVHCSVHDSGNLQFGLAWVNMAPEDSNRIESIVEEIKSRVLKKK